MAFLWFVHYYVYGDMLGVILFHIIADFGAQVSDKIPAPWDNLTESTQTKNKKSICSK